MKRSLLRILNLLLNGCPDPMCAHDPPCGAVCATCRDLLGVGSALIPTTSEDVSEWACGRCAELAAEIDRIGL